VLPNLNKNIGNDLFSQFFGFGKAHGEIVEVGIKRGKQLLISLLVVKPGDPVLQISNSVDSYYHWQVYESGRQSMKILRRKC
jgi:hypothetical protein